MIHSKSFDFVVFDDLKLSLLDIPNSNKNNILTGYNVKPIKAIKFKHSRDMTKRHSMIVIIIPDSSRWIYQISMSINPNKFQIGIFTEHGWDCSWANGMITSNSKQEVSLVWFYDTTYFFW